MDRTSKLTSTELGAENRLDPDERDLWTLNRVTDMIAKTVATTRGEVEQFTANYIQEGKLDPRELASQIRAHFSDFPEWKASRYARTDTRDAYNTARLLTGQANGFQVVQARDALAGPSDADCEARHGQFFTIQQALREDEHPNGTLEWAFMPGELSVSRVSEVPGGQRGACILRGGFAYHFPQ